MPFPVLLLCITFLAVTSPSGSRYEMQQRWRHRQEQRRPVIPPLVGVLLLELNISLCYLLCAILQKQKASWLSTAARGHTYLPPVGPLLSVEVPIAWDGQLYKLNFTRTSPSALGFSINKQKGEVQYRQQSDGSYLLSIYSDPPQEQQSDQQLQQMQQPQELQHGVHPRLLRFSATEEPLGLRLELGDNSLMVLDQRDPSEMRSDVNGRLVRYLVGDGEHVKKGQPFAEVEAMKMILTLTVREPWCLNHRVFPWVCV